MKKISFLLFALFFCFSLSAEEIYIAKEKNEDPQRKNDRSSVAEVRASIEDGVINIETELATWGVSVIVYNSGDAVVYTSVSSTESKTHEFAIGSLPADDYTIEVQIGSDLYEGVFIL